MVFDLLFYSNFCIEVVCKVDYWNFSETLPLSLLKSSHEQLKRTLQNEKNKLAMEFLNLLPFSLTKPDRQKHPYDSIEKHAFGLSYNITGVAKPALCMSRIS